MAGDGWCQMSLGDFVTLQRGHDLPEEQRQPGNIPILGSFGITGWHDEARTPGPGVTVGRSGASFGVATYSPVDFWPLNTALYVIDFHGNDARFAYYFLKRFDFRSYNSGSAQPSLNRNFVHPVSVDIPPPSEQRAIAHILGVLDDKIELNRRMNETLESIARALFKSWFVDFDPVRAKAEGRDPGLPQPIAGEFPNIFSTSEIGELPDGWRMVAFSDMAVLLREQVDPGKQPQTVFSLYSIPAFDNGQKPAPEYGRAIKSIKFRVPADSVLFSKLNPVIERVWLVDPEPNELTACSTEFLVLFPKPPVGRSFLYCLMRSDEFRQAVAELVTGTSNSHQRARGEGILGLRVTCPSSETLKDFEGVATPILNRTSANRREARALAALRDTLLPKLISGELRVKDAEVFIEAVA